MPPVSAVRAERMTCKYFYSIVLHTKTVQPFAPQSIWSHITAVCAVHTVHETHAIACLAARLRSRNSFACFTCCGSTSPRPAGPVAPPPLGV